MWTLRCCKIYLKSRLHAGVAKLVDALDLGSSAERRGGSSPSTRTRHPTQVRLR